MRVECCKWQRHIWGCSSLANKITLWHSVNAEVLRHSYCAILSPSQNVLKSISCVYLQMAAERRREQNSSCFQPNCVMAGFILWANTLGECLNFGTTPKTSAVLCFVLFFYLPAHHWPDQFMLWQNERMQTSGVSWGTTHAFMHAHTYILQKT